MVHKNFIPDKLPLKQLHQIIIGGVGPRPIALVGSMNKGTGDNLAPFSFFNAFSSNPPIVAISPAFLGKSATPKDTLTNITANGEFTVSSVSYSMVQQMRLCAGDYPSQIDEFDLSGFTKLPSKTVAPAGVSEASIIFECKLIQHLELGSGRAGGNLLLGKITYIRVAEQVLDADGLIDPLELDQIGRLGKNWYTRANRGLFSLAPYPLDIPMGFDGLPDCIKRSTVLSANNLSQLAQFPVIPDITVLGINFTKPFANLPVNEIHEKIKVFIENDQLLEAWALVRNVAEKT